MKLSSRSRSLIVTLAVLAAAGATFALLVVGRGFDARSTPGAIETAVATRVRALMIPGEARARANPLAQTDETFREGLEHFADHCAVCHGNDGSGATDFGRGLYPKPPDLRAEATQRLTDGELFYIIERGVPLTGMPGFGNGTAEGESGSWHLVQFIRRLPRLTDAELAEMAGLNPISAEAWRQRQEEEAFLRGEDPPPLPRSSGHGH